MCLARSLALAFAFLNCLLWRPACAQFPTGTHAHESQPPRVTEGGPAFTLTIDGTSFDSTSQVVTGPGFYHFARP